MEQGIFATVAKGLEEVLAAEVEAIGGRNMEVAPGGIHFSGDMAVVYKANLWLRVANRVLLPVARFPCGSKEELYEGVRLVDWREYLNPAMTLAVDANVKDSSLKHSKYAALKTKDAVVDQLRERLGARPNVDTSSPDLRINVHIHRDVAILSLDSSGESLHKRGYRVASVEAPLKETLAAGLVDLTGWDGGTPLVDPMCGSGTILIEGVLKALNVAPGLLGRDFGFQRWLGFDGRLWKSLVEEAKEMRRDRLSVKVIGRDISEKAVEAAAANARAAFVDRSIDFATGGIAAVTPPPGPGVVILNPPYGERLGEKSELEAVYKEIGDVFKQKFKGYTGYVFTGNPDLAKRIGLKPSRRSVLYNGPIDSRLIKFEIY